MTSPASSVERAVGIPQEVVSTLREGASASGDNAPQAPIGTNQEVVSTLREGADDVSQAPNVERTVGTSQELASTLRDDASRASTIGTSPGREGTLQVSATEDTSSGRHSVFTS